MIGSNFIGNYSNHEAPDVCYSLKIEDMKGISKYRTLKNYGNYESESDNRNIPHANEMRGLFYDYVTLNKAVW